ncbi:hypothetical protein [Hyalangium gracile]|uniref:hypothetical protein n=1 Tax=Hyalangium gracile TaxID=394092 RepID=UPI001CCFB212|nr:hypothetical protein [Hyalangium gracile]
METGQPFPLQMPSFLQGALASVSRKARKEGQRCGAQYLKDGSFPSARELISIPPGEVVIAHEVVDFQREQLGWRLYMMSSVMSGLYEAADWQNVFQVRDAYEAFCRDTPWGALYFAISPTGPASAERTALRLRAALRFWEPLQSARYLFTSPQRALSLEDLMMAACGWAVEAWCPTGDGSVRERLALAAERMARASRDDSVEAILRQLPRALAQESGLRHREVLADPAFQRQQLAALDGEAFAHVSAAWTAPLIRQLHLWDRQLETHPA